MEENTKEERGEKQDTSALPPKKINPIDKFFGITASGSNFKTEIIAGLTTFMAMVYILMVNAGMFSDAGLNYGGMYVATAVGAIAGTLFMAFLAKMPLAQASGMGINAFVVYTLIFQFGFTYANCMVFTLLDGLIFVILTATGLRKKIFDAIPEAVRLAIPVGIGMFIAFIGMQQAGIILNDDSTLVKFVSFNVLAEGFSFGAVIPAIVALAGVLAIAVMSKQNVKGAILWGLLGATALFYALSGVGYAFGDKICVETFTLVQESWASPFEAFAAWGTESVGQVFVSGFDFSGF